MKNQIEFPFRGDRKSCCRMRHRRREQRARRWFKRMHEVVARAEDQIPLEQPDNINLPFEPVALGKTD